MVSAASAPAHLATMDFRFRTRLRILRLRRTDARQKAGDPQWQWGHPDEWPEAEWRDYKREKAKTAAKESR